MKITKDTSISIGALIAVVPLALWFWGAKADKEEVDKVEIKVEEIKKEEQQYKLKQLEIDVRQTMMIDRLDEQLKGE